MNWDLSNLYKSIDDLDIKKKDKDLVAKQTNVFIKKYKGKIATYKAARNLINNILNE